SATPLGRPRQGPRCGRRPVRRLPRPARTGAATPHRPVATAYDRSVARSAQYVEVADTLAARWTGLPPGSLVASEHQIADEFGINRLTAREALRELERRMVVRRERGRGTFTAFRLDYPVELGGVASFHRIVESHGH